MSAVAKPRLKAVDSSRKLRSVEVAQRAEADSWALAEAVHEDYIELSASRDADANQEIGEIYDEIHEEHRTAGLDTSRSYIKDLRQTATAWPPEERVPQASFSAHKLLRSASYDRNRKQVLERLSKKSKNGNVTKLAVEVWISESKPRHTWTFLQLVEKRIRGSVKGAASPWHLVADEDRQAIATILHRVGNEVAAGTFPPKADQ